MKKHFCLHGLLQKIISNYGSQFLSKLFHAILRGLGIKSAMSTTYHPQTDGQSEQCNQEIEAYLPTYCSYCCNNWVKQLPIAEFTFNSHKYLLIEYLPFYLMQSLKPQSHILILSIAVPMADKCRDELQQVWEDVTVALTITAKWIKEHYDCYICNAPEFKKGQKVWLNTRNFHVLGVSKKLVDQYARPYLVKCKVGNLAYKFRLPKNFALYLVFHVCCSYYHTRKVNPLVNTLQSYQ